MRICLSFFRQSQGIQLSPARWQVMVGSTLLLALMTGCGERKPAAPMDSDPSTPQVEDVVVVSQHTANDIPVATEPNLPMTYQVNNITGEAPQRFEDLYIDPAVLANAPQVWVSADFQVADVLKSTRSIAEAAKNLKGYVASTHISNVRSDMRGADKKEQHVTLVSYHRQATMGVRIPKAQTTAFLEQVQKQVLLLNAQAFGVDGSLPPEVLTNDETAMDYDSASNNGGDGDNNVGNGDNSNANDADSDASVINTEDVDRTYSLIELTFRQMEGVYRENSRNISAIINAEIPQEKY